MKCQNKYCIMFSPHNGCCNDGMDEATCPARIKYENATQEICNEAVKQARIEELKLISEFRLSFPDEDMGKLDLELSNHFASRIKELEGNG
jgi:hypothetical protein